MHDSPTRPSNNSWAKPRATQKLDLGVVCVPQTFGSLLQPNLHTHCLVSRGVWNANGQWIPVPYIDTNAAEKLFRHKILHFLERKGLLSDERIELLNSF